MKRLILVRHAKSSWKYDVGDHDRPLKTRGKNDAELLAKHTANFYDHPDKIISSTAKRARNTSEYFVKYWDLDATKYSLSRDLYDFSGEDLISVIKSCDDSINSLMIFGHNFAITDFVNTFGTLTIDNVPTCGFVVIDFEIDSWKNLSKGRTSYKLFPREIRDNN